MSSKDYWAQRARRNEEHAQELAGKYSQAEKRLHRQAYNRIEDRVNALYTQVLEQGAESLTRTQMWEYSRYRELLRTIDSEAARIGKDQLAQMEKCLDEVFESTIGQSVTSVDASQWSTAARVSKDTVLGQNWSGMSYSERIWRNASALAGQLKDAVEDFIVAGRNPAALKRALMERFNTSWYNADRLIRTETAFVQSKASLANYHRYGVAQVRWIASPGACDICAPRDDKLYDIDAVPQIPAHPNCRCCYAPVVELGAELGAQTKALREGQKDGIIPVQERLPDAYSLSDKDTRAWYLKHDARIPGMIDRTQPLEAQARQAFDLRNRFRTMARDLMSNQDTRRELDRKNPNKSFEELIADKMRRKSMTREEAIRDTIDTASKTNKDVNRKLGLDGD